MTNLLLTLLLASAFTAEPAKPAAIRIVSAELNSQWDLLFAGKEGWIGGDGLYSASISPERVLWTFGDSFWGTVHGQSRAGCKFINNAVAIQAGVTPAAPIKFFAGPVEEGSTDAAKVTSFFRPADGRGFYWPHAMLEHEGKLVLFLAQIETTPSGGPFGFHQVGEWVALVENPNDPPGQWRMEQHRLPFVHYAEGDTLSFGSGLCRSGEHFYIYGYREKEPGFGKRQLVTARVLTTDLVKFDQWQFWNGKSWTSDAKESAGTVSQMATELSVNPLPPVKGPRKGPSNGQGKDGDQFLLVYTENGIGERILARTAAAPHGPWSEPILAYQGRIMEEDKGLFCYGAKEHPWARTDGELLISYCDNDWDFARLFTNDRLYRPHFVRVKFERTSHD